jgi:hypothetical protein
MGLLTLLTFPVSGPLLGGRWLLQTLLLEAERQYFDVSAIRQKMAEAEDLLLSGAIDDETFEQVEEELLDRLLEAREYHLRKQAEQEGEVP